MANTIQLVLGLSGEIIDKTNGYIVASNSYSNMIQIVSPFPASDSVSLEFYLRNARITTYSQYIGLMKNELNESVQAKDVVSNEKAYYQTVKEWYVWQVSISQEALAAISRYHAGKVDITVKFKEFRNVYTEEATTRIGTFGSRKSTTQGDLPASSAIGDFYECDFLDYYSVETSEYYTLNDYAYYTATGWLKGTAYQYRLNSSSTQLGVDPSIVGQDIESITPNTGELLASRIADIESVILGELPEEYADGLFVRKEIDLNYTQVNPLITDQILVERDRITHYADIDDLTQGLNEVESAILRTPSALSAGVGQGLYADDDSILIGNSAGDNIQWDGNNIFFNGTIQSGTITDPELLDGLKGDDGITPVFGVDYFNGLDGYTPLLGVDYFNGDNGKSIEYKGALTFLSDLTLIVNPQLNDTYRVNETNELWLFNGSIWITMGQFQGEDAKYITVRGESIFRYSPGESIPDNTNIVLTAKIYGGLTTYDWQYWNGSTWITLNATTQTITINYTTPAFNGTDLARVRCVSDDGLYDEHNLINIVDGDTYNTYWAYADTSDGSGGTFSTTYYVDALYTGRYESVSETQSQTNTDYNWSRFKGDIGPAGTSVVLKGTVTTFINLPLGAIEGDLWIVEDENGEGYVSDGADNWTNVGAIQGPKGDPLYHHVAYADTADGSGGTFSVTYYNGALYRGDVIDTNIADPASYTGYTWTRLKGEQGEHAVHGDLTTFHAAFTADNDGTNYDVSGFSANFTVGEGITDVTTSSTFTVTTATQDGLTLAIGINTGSITLSGASWTSDELVFELSAVYNGITIYKYLTVTKTIRGQIGADPIYVKVSGNQAFKYLKDTITPINTTITFSSVLFGDLTEYNWQYYNGTIWTNLSGIINTSDYTLTYNQSEWNTDTSLRIRCISGTVYDEMTVLKLYDGATGEDAINGLLTDENSTVPAAYDGNGYDTSNVGGTFKVYYGLSDVTTSSTFTVTNGTLDGLTLSIGANTGIYSLETPDDTWISDYTVFELNATYGTITISKNFKISKARVGIQGQTGPGLSFRGVFDQTETYYKDVIRQDIVEYPANSQTYYAVNETIAPGTWDPGDWSSMTSFAAIATDILLAQNATITKGLVMGDGTNDGFIRSYSKTALGTGDGFYLNGDGKFNFGSSTGNNIDWDGTDLIIKGDIQADSLTLLNDATITKGLTMGSSTTKGFIASYGMSSLTDTTGGYYISGDGKFVFGKPGYNSLEWDGNNLSVNLPFTVREFYPPTEQTLSMEIINNTTSDHSYYYRYTKMLSSLTGAPSAWILADTIPAGNTETHNITGLEFGRKYYIEHREGTDENTIQTQYLSTSNILINQVPSHTGWSISVTDGAGGSMDIKIESAIRSGIDEVWTISGTATIGASTETMTVTMPHSLYYATLHVTVDSSNSAGAGLDGVYGEIIGDPTTQFKLTHDWKDTTNSTDMFWTIRGYKLDL